MRLPWKDSSFSRSSDATSQGWSIQRQDGSGDAPWINARFGMNDYPRPCRAPGGEGGHFPGRRAPTRLPWADLFVRFQRADSAMTAIKNWFPHCLPTPWCRPSKQSVFVVSPKHAAAVERLVVFEIVGRNEPGMEHPTAGRKRRCAVDKREVWDERLP